ncbi:MAG: CBS domain-containing protein, partial [Planctomycetales bacterium]|nr:CBS domain-containing protein [Planctomycetales bacterium]
MQPLLKFFTALDLRATGKWFVLSAVVGLVAGLGAIAFQFLVEVVQHVGLAMFAGYVPTDAAGEQPLFAAPEGEFLPWMIVVVMTVGGLVSGWLVYRFAPEAQGTGTDAAVDAFHNRRGQIGPLVPVIKTIASAITLGTGGSAGREGPIAQIGAGFGSALANRLGLSARDRRIMLAAGMAAGVGAIFRAPLAAALFAGEILYRDADLDSDVIVPAAFSSIVGYSVYSLALPPRARFAPLFGQVQQVQFGSLLELLPYAVLAVVLALVAILFIKCHQGGQRLFAQTPLHPVLRPMVGAALAGVIGVGLFLLGGQDPHLLGVLSTGYGTLQQATNPEASMGLQILMAVALVKIVTTSLTIGSGGAGGIFGPSMVIGGCLGAAVGQAFHQWWPAVVTHPHTFAFVGMAGFFAGAAHAPFSTIIMVTEMTGNYQLLLPTMWVSTLCFLFCKRWSIYPHQVPTRLESPAHRGDFIVDVLEGIKVDDVYQRDRKMIRIPEGMRLKGIVHTLAMTAQRYFPVVDENDRLVGIFSSEDVRSYLYDEAIWELANARDVMVTKIV